MHRASFYGSRDFFSISFFLLLFPQHSLCQRNRLEEIKLPAITHSPSAKVKLWLCHNKWNTCQNLEGKEFHSVTLFSVMLMQPPYIHTLQRTGVCRWILEKQCQRQEGESSSKNLCPQGTGFPSTESPFTSSCSYIVLKLHSLPKEAIQHSKNLTDFQDLFILCFYGSYQYSRADVSKEKHKLALKNKDCNETSISLKL